MRYLLNFKGFKDTEKDVLGHKIIDSDLIESLSIFEVNDLVKHCITNVNNLGFNINEQSIVSVEQISSSEFLAITSVVGQNSYVLFFNEKVFHNYDFILSAIYHELCHVYWLNKLFNDRIIAWDYFKKKLSVESESSLEIAKLHLNSQGGHTKYWQEAADKINNNINLNRKLTIYTNKDESDLLVETVIDDYYTLDFEGFKDTVY